MSEFKKDLLQLTFSPNVNIEGIEEQVVNIALPPAQDVGTSIGGTVTDNGVPVSGATVKIFDSNGNPYMHTITDAEGKYLFENLPIGIYNVGVAHKDYRLSEFQSINLTPGIQGVINVAMQKDVTLALGAITGLIVTEKDGVKLPIANAKITLYDMENNIVAITYSISDGEYAFYDVAVGQYKIVVSYQGYVTSSMINLIVTSGIIINTDVTLVKDSTTSTGTINGVITNTQGAIVGGCFVGLYRITMEAGIRKETLVAYTKTNAQGQYLFGDVVEGDYIVKAKLNA